MLGRQVTAALRRPLQARLRTTAAPQTPFALAIRTFAYAPRLLDSAGRPRKAVGEPSRPVKRAVKKAAKKAATPEEKALIAEKKRIAKEKLKKQNAAAKEKQKKQDAAAKKAAKKAAMTPEQLEQKKAKLQKAEITELKKAALNPPLPSSTNPWLVFVREKSKELKTAIESAPSKYPKDVKYVLSEHSRNAAAAWKALSAGELEHYNHTARAEKEASQAELKRWVESHSIAEIKLANTARRALHRRLGSKRSSPLTRLIEDERLPKRACSGYIFFSNSRQASGDFKHIAVRERAKLIGQEWNAMSAEEKEKYNKLSEEDKKRFEAERSAMEA